MFANPSINVCIPITRMFVVVSAQAIIEFVKESLDSVGLKGKGADNRDREIIPAFRTHFS
jgi:hypothetical protein